MAFSGLLDAPLVTLQNKTFCNQCYLWSTAGIIDDIFIKNDIITGIRDDIIFIENAGADPEKWKERWLKWGAEGTVWNFKYSLGHVNCFASIHMLLQLSVFYHHHEAPCLSDWFGSHDTLCLQEWFVQVNQRVLKQRILWTLHTQGRAPNPPLPPPRISPWNDIITHSWGIVQAKYAISCLCRSCVKRIRMATARSVSKSLRESWPWTALRLNSWSELVTAIFLQLL